MQRYCTELTERLLKSLDKEYNVIDMGVVVDVITALEKTTITKEVLESTRLGKHINELRRKTNNDALAKRAKDLVRRWRDMVLPSVHSTPQPTPADTAPPALNGAKPHSPALRSLKPHSPALRGLKPQSPLLRDVTSLRVLSPALSVNSDHSRSPNASLNKQSITPTSNHRISSTNVSPVLCSTSQNHTTTEAVPRTHSSNKRLRKEENKEQRQYQSPFEAAQPKVDDEESYAKKQRLNGENISGNLNSQVPSPTLKERISSDRLTETIPLEAAVDSGPKKRGRKKGSKYAKRQPLLEDRVKEKLASISRNPKLKTTQELLADLRARVANLVPRCTVGTNALPSQSVAEPPTTEDVLRGSSNAEQVSNYPRCSQKNSSLHRISETPAAAAAGRAQSTRLKSKENCREPSAELCQDRPDTIAGSSACRPPSSSQRELTVEQILAQLPPLDLSAINWSEDYSLEIAGSTEEQNGVKCSQRREVTAEDLDRLHGQCVEGLNGNYQPRLPPTGTSPDGDGSSARNDGEKVSAGLSNAGDVKSVSSNNQTDNGTEFREWQEMLARPSYEGQTLHIMPYVIID